MLPLVRRALVGALVIACAPWGCGESGSNPIQQPEVRFEVRPAGQATFRVDSLIGNGANHTSVVGQEFTATSAFDFILENAAPPYLGTFTLVSGDQITVTLTVITNTGQTQVSDTARLPGTSAAVISGGQPPTTTPGPSVPEVRFDLCTPLSGQPACSTTSDPGTFGVAFTGTLGDQFTSHVLNGFTPTIYFLEGARENANGVFSPAPVTGAPLIVRLYLNGALSQTSAGEQSVIIREDL